MTFTWYHLIADGSDYIGGTFTVNFGTSANEVKCREITVFSDNERENHEDFFVDLNFTDMEGIRLGEPSRTMVIIEGTKVAPHSHIHCIVYSFSMQTLVSLSMTQLLVIH